MIVDREIVQKIANEYHNTTEDIDLSLTAWQALTQWAFDYIESNMHENEIDVETLAVYLYGKSNRGGKPIGYTLNNWMSCARVMLINHPKYIIEKNTELFSAIEAATEE